ncbi:hypothetical protein [Actinokineospora xionganensis]|uniref:Uncharacterized protein n=1 Tax=Actinokineospora xionganensis TaxID=2684470 RepID=A0ABR7LF10_9PSEU|nr:hypothetical protein [Actinokineospora xionganensis]MBC6451304.1 hypothetical protein [Actinokineospora xionganensis]
MIPTYDVVPRIQVLPAALTRMTPRRVVEGFSLVRDYEPQFDITWEEAVECLDAEAKWLERAATTQDAKEFDELLYSASEQEAGDDFDYLFRGMDVGVAGLVFVLSAAGYATCYSCRGHAGIMTERAPQVRLATEPDRLQLLVGYAEHAECGLETDDEGLVTAYAPTVMGLHKLARLMADDRAVFETMENPSWLAQALELQDRQEDVEPDDDGDES